MKGFIRNMTFSRLLLALIMIGICNLLEAQQISMQMHTQPAWPPGKDVPVTIEINTGGLDAFARFYQSLPLGFSASELESAGADFYWDNSQVNLVWTKLPGTDLIRIQYLVKADAALSGSFRLAGRLDYVINGKERHSAELSPQMIKLEKGAKVADYDEPSQTNLISAQPEQKDESVREKKDPVVKEQVEPTQNVQADQPTDKTAQKIEFRVQVAISSEKFGKTELESRINCTLEHGITVLKAGSMYKYQTGSFSLYSQAQPYLASLKELGVKDAFIVAFRGSEQIAISLARTLTE